MIALRGRRSFMVQGRHGIDLRRPPRRNATRHKRREQQDHHCKAQRPRIGGLHSKQKRFDEPRRSQRNRHAGAVLAPMPSAMTSRATSVKLGVFFSVRAA